MMFISIDWIKVIGEASLSSEFPPPDDSAHCHHHSLSSFGVLLGAFLESPRVPLLPWASPSPSALEKFIGTLMPLSCSSLTVLRAMSLPCWPVSLQGTRMDKTFFH